MHVLFSPQATLCIAFHIPPSTSQFQSLSTVAVWLSASLTLWILTAGYRFCFGERLWISWFPRLRFCERSRNLKLTITITITIASLRNWSEESPWSIIYPSIASVNQSVYKLLDVVGRELGERSYLTFFHVFYVCTFDNVRTSAICTVNPPRRSPLLWLLPVVFRF